MTESELATVADEQTVLAEIADMLAQVLEDMELTATEVGMEDTFHEDLGMESIDLVMLGNLLSERYGDRVNFAEFAAELDLEAIIALTVGDLVTYIVRRLGGEEH
ncbi:acyl carrier protein [Sciscionella sediminilitoris]|uniref:acyl carrier protein n=1 Tax=Sciscionella sediminilitoris TaxID=1445613 RepID=UPI0004DFCBB7|nr:acyl carrier protein [Sciscionella sp. SE31]